MKYYTIPEDRIHEIEACLESGVGTLEEILSWYSEECTDMVDNP